MTSWGARIGAVAAAVAVVVVAGCVGGPATEPSASPIAVVAPSTTPTASITARPSPSPSASPSPQPTPTPTPTPTPPPPASTGPTATATWPHADPELEAYLPERIRTTALIRFSVPGAQLAGGGSDMCLWLCGNEPGDFARSLGVPLSAITIAFAIPDGDGIAIGAVAFRAVGAKPERLIDAGAALHGVVGGDGDPGFPVRIAGRDAYFVDRFGRPQYLVPDGDVLLFLFGEPPTVGGPNHIDPKGSIPPDVEALVRAMP